MEQRMEADRQRMVQRIKAEPQRVEDERQAEQQMFKWMQSLGERMGQPMPSTYSLLHLLLLALP